MIDTASTSTVYLRRSLDWPRIKFHDGGEYTMSVKRGSPPSVNETLNYLNVASQGRQGNNTRTHQILYTSMYPMILLPSSTSSYTTLPIVPMPKLTCLSLPPTVWMCKWGGLKRNESKSFLEEMRPSKCCVFQVVTACEWNRSWCFLTYQDCSVINLTSG